MKRVAFLSYDWDYKIVSEYYLGLQEYLKERSDVQLTIFNAFGHYHVTHVPHKSVFELFSLVDPSEYDGLLIQGNRTWPPELRQQIVDKAVELGRPVVSINYNLQGAHSVGTNNYQEEYKLVRRVLADRGCTKPAFVNGLKTSVEACDRAQGYRDACAELGIEDARFYQANWQTEAGVLVAKKMLRKRNDLPDVIFCCNDHLAVGVQETLQGAGVRVPEDVMVAGFDNNKIGQTATPRITTVDRDYRTIAVTAFDLLMQLMDGQDAPEHAFSSAEHILSESCGYEGQSDADRLSALRVSGTASEQFFDVLADFQRAALDSESLFALLENCELFAHELDCDNISLSLSDTFLNARIPEAAADLCAMSHLVARNMRTEGMRCDAKHVYASHETRAILPPGMPTNSCLYLVSPLVYNDIFLGTMVSDSVPNALRSGFNAFFMTVLAASLVAARKSELLAAAYSQLEER